MALSLDASRLRLFSECIKSSSSTVPSRTTCCRRCHGRNGFRRYLANAAPPRDRSEETNTYCRDLVRKHDRHAYLVSHFFPKGLQDACFAIRAFYVHLIELAMIPDMVSNPAIGQMRLQFWRDALKTIFETPSKPPLQHPISTALYNASKTAHIVPYHLNRIIDAREEDLRFSGYLTIESLTAHAEATSSTLNYTLLSMLGLTSETIFHAASHIGIAQTIAILLRALPYHASQRRMVIPASISAKHRVNQEEVFRHGGDAAHITDAVYDFAVVANDHLITAREMFKSKDGAMEVPETAMPVFLTAMSAGNFLSRLEASQFNAFDPKLQIRDGLRVPWQIWWNYNRRRF